MNNLNNISFDYLSRLTKRKYLNSYKSIASIKKQVFNYVSKEKNLLDNHKEIEKQKEYYNNQKKLHNKKNNNKNNNRIKEQNLNGFNLKQINNILKKNKNNESINLTNLTLNTINNLNTLNNNSKNKNDNLITQRNNTIHNYNNSGKNFSYNKKNKNKSNDFHHQYNYSNNFNSILNTNKTNNNIDKLINNNNININKKNISYNHQKTISNIIYNLKGKIDKNKNIKEKILKIRPGGLSPKEISGNSQLKMKSKEKNNNQKNNYINVKNILGNFIKVKQTKKMVNKKNIILRNDDNNIKDKKLITEYENQNNFNNIKKNIHINCISDINEISIEGVKKDEENKDIKNEKEEKDEKEKDNKENSNKINPYKFNSYKSHTIDIKLKKNIYEIKNNFFNNIKNNIDLKNNSNDKEENEIKEDKYLGKENKEEKINDKKVLDKNDKKGLNKSLTDIFNNKEEDPQQGKEYITDIIESLLLEENYYLNEKNYIDPHYLENENSELTPEMRTVAVDWLVLIHHKIFKFQENTLFLSIQIFDRFLSKKDLDTEKTELLLLTSFMLASKHNEIDYVNMQETLQLAQNKFTKEQVIEMESEILGIINFEILCPTMCEYFTLYASFLNLSEAKINHGFYILNIVLVDFHMLEYPNFMLALAVVRLITKKNNKKLIKMIKTILENKKLDKFLEFFEEGGYEEIFDICSKIKLLYNTFLETKYKNIQEKFAESKYNCVSTYTSI